MPQPVDDPNLLPGEADIDVALLDYLISLTPSQRLTLHQQALEGALAIREAGIKHYGFDPRSAHTPDPE